MHTHAHTDSDTDTQTPLQRPRRQRAPLPRPLLRCGLTRAFQPRRFFLMPAAPACWVSSASSACPWNVSPSPPVFSQPSLPAGLFPSGRRLRPARFRQLRQPTRAATARCAAPDGGPAADGARLPHVRTSLAGEYTRYIQLYIQYIVVHLSYIY